MKATQRNKARALAALAVLSLLAGCTAVIQMGRPKTAASTIYIGPDAPRSASTAQPAACAPYRRPTLENAPELDYLSERELADSEALAIRFATHIAELRKHLHDVHSSYAQAEREQLQTCVVQPLG